MIQPFARLAAPLLGLALVSTGCAERSETHRSAPEAQRAAFAQLSAGGGIAGFDFFVSGKRVGALLVTNGVFDVGAGYADEQEFWRWDPGSLALLESGAVNSVQIAFNGTADTWDPALVAAFEAGSGTWSAWSVNRQFDVSDQSQVVWNRPDEGRILYRLRSRAWGGIKGNIDYYLLLDFAAGGAIPEMVWYIDYDDYSTWLASEAADGDSDGIYEVRLEEANGLNQATLGVGYELKTVK